MLIGTCNWLHRDSQRYLQRHSHNLSAISSVKILLFSTEMKDVQLLHWIIWGMWREKRKTSFLRYSIKLPSCFQQNVSLRRANNMLWESLSSGLCRWLVPLIREPGKLRRSLKKRRIMKLTNHKINLIHKFQSLADLCFNVLVFYLSQNRSKWKQMFVRWAH